MKSLSTLILSLLCVSIFAQNDTINPDSLSELVAPAKFAYRDSSCFIDVCKNDTMWLYDWQRDSTIYYRKRSNGMSIWGIGPTADTLIHFEKADSFPSDFHGWLHDWMIQHRDCSYNMIYYNTGQLHMMFQDYGEGHMGEFREYHKNGRLKCSGSYCPAKLGTRYGVWTWYDEQGNIIRTKKYTGGKYCREKREPLNGRSYNLFRKCDYF